MTTNRTQQTWHWVFEKLPSTNEPAGEFDLGFSTMFENDKLTQVAISDRFEVIFPKEMVLAMVRSLGRAKVDQKKREVTSDWKEDNPEVRLGPPARAEVVRLLGQPRSVTNSAQTTNCRYEYQLKSPSRKPTQAMLARVNCSFARDTDRLDCLDIKYGDLRIHLVFRPPPPTASKSAQGVKN